MKFLHLVRVGQSDAGTFGVLVYEHVPFAVTLERPWKENQANISSIPAGDYRCKRVDSPKFGNTFEITDVPGRSHVLFHKGNRTADTLGCVLVGESFATDKKIPIIADSSGGYAEFKALLINEDEFLLRIHEPVIK